MIPLQLQQLFTKLQLLDTPTVSTKSLTQHAFGWKHGEAKVQQDVHELVRLLLDELENDLSSSKTNAGLVKALFEGEMTTEVKCLKCGFISKTSDIFRDIVLQAVGQEDLVASLLTQTRPEL
ncbi:unnamed protein product, partial [Ascophyllum nodosum]